MHTFAIDIFCLRFATVLVEHVCLMWTICMLCTHSGTIIRLNDAAHAAAELHNFPYFGISYFISLVLYTAIGYNLIVLQY